jgi:hypothetical protein
VTQVYCAGRIRTHTTNAPSSSRQGAQAGALERIQDLVPLG